MAYRERLCPECGASAWVFTLPAHMCRFYGCHEPDARRLHGICNRYGNTWPIPDEPPA